VRRDERRRAAWRPALCTLAVFLAAIAGATARGAALEAPAPGSAPASGPAAAMAGELGPPSAAEHLIFMDPYLAAIHEPRTLVYDYVAESTGAPRVTDHATLALVARKDGRCCGTHVDFLSGANAVGLPDLDDPQGNPIVMYFLESEVRLLERSTHGQSSHFRRRIREALASGATVRDTTVRWGGRDVPAREVHIAPFENDPYRARFEREAKTEYTFLIADAVPGGIVRLASVLPPAGDATGARRSLALADPQPPAPAKSASSASPGSPASK